MRPVAVPAGRVCTFARPRRREVPATLYHEAFVGCWCGGGAGRGGDAPRPLAAARACCRPAATGTGCAASRMCGARAGWKRADSGGRAWRLPSVCVCRWRRRAACSCVFGRGAKISWGELAARERRAAAAALPLAPRRMRGIAASPLMLLCGGGAPIAGWIAARSADRESGARAPAPDPLLHSKEPTLDAAAVSFAPRVCSCVSARAARRAVRSACSSKAAHRFPCCCAAGCARAAAFDRHPPAWRCGSRLGLTAFSHPCTAG